MKHSTAFMTLCDHYRASVNEIDCHTVKEWQQQQKPFVFIDVRETDEFEAGHLPHAIHLSKGWLEAKIHHHVPSFDTTVVLYCGGGNRSILSAYNLQQMGYKNVFSMTGGYRSWE